MLRYLKRFLALIFQVSTIQIKRQRNKINVFDLVSMTDSPKPKDVYMIYSFSDKDVYMLKWGDYCKGGLFDAGGDKQVVYPFRAACNNLYKINDVQIDPYKILMHCSMKELNTYAVRFAQVFGANLPLLGMFIDPHDHHCMIVLSVRGSTRDGFSTVYDLDMAPTAGILHKHQIAHTLRTSYLIDHYVLRSVEIGDLVYLLQQQWRKEVINDILLRMFDAVRITDVKNDKFSIYGLGNVSVQNNPTPPRPQTQTKKKEKIT